MTSQNTFEKPQSTETPEVKVGDIVVDTLKEAMRTSEPDTPEDQLFKRLFSGVTQAAEEVSDIHKNESIAGRDAVELNAWYTTIQKIDNLLNLRTDARKIMNLIGRASEKAEALVQEESKSIGIREGYALVSERVQAIPHLIETQPETEQGTQVRGFLEQIQEQIEADNKFLKVRLYQEYVKSQATNPEGYYTRRDMQEAVEELMPLWEMNNFSKSPEYRAQLTEKLDSYGIEYDADKLLASIQAKREQFYGKQ